MFENCSIRDSSFGPSRFIFLKMFVRWLLFLPTPILCPTIQTAACVWNVAKLRFRCAFVSLVSEVLDQKVYPLLDRADRQD